MQVKAGRVTVRPRESGRLAERVEYSQPVLYCRCSRRRWSGNACYRQWAAEIDTIVALA
ncbi:hypothetical protein SAMN05421833_11937 [Microbispora rosea]|uniref:Uncharacterized protein n=1 Tax=Microbispora rosea TaxID=58117 RepID=A0A1N7ER51_9ACTN|nr:hypothetical protein Mro03_57310 [Microbispora rosea subsp. rosea]SIR90519.1 hypothetical protein SAMN05421833_11937 [Microbispora rosea]